MVKEASTLVPSAEISIAFTFQDELTAESPSIVSDQPSTFIAGQKEILVIGASGGIGRKIVSQLSSDCFVLAMENKRPLDSNLTSLPNVACVQADLSTDRWEDAIEAAMPNDQLYGIVHAAWPGAPRGGLLHTEDDVIEQQLAFGAVYTIRLARLLLSHAPPEGSRFVALGSGAGSHKPVISHAAYSIGKAALENTVTLLAPELARKKITITSVCPSYVPAGIHEGTTDAQQRKEAAMLPIGRLCLSEDIVGIVQYLLSPAASFVSGQAIGLSGGGL